MIKKIINLPRIYKQITMMAVDVILVIVVLLSSFSMRLGLWFVPDNDLIYLVYGAPFIAYPIF